MKFGLPGQADLSGILDDGRRVEIEVKSATGALRPEQILFKAMIEKFNGIYIVARSVEEAHDKLEAARRGTSGSGARVEGDPAGGAGGSGAGTGEAPDGPGLAEWPAAYTIGC